MENEFETITPINTGASASVIPERPLSPVERILQGQVDGRPLFSINGKMDGLLIALAKVLKLLTKDKLSQTEKRKAFEALDKISTEDIQKAVESASIRAIEEITSFEDITLHKVKAPEIEQTAVDYVSPQASKDFSTRINNGYFASVARHTVKMKDILQAVADVTTFYKLSPKAALSLLRRCLRDPARQLMENLVSSNASLESLFVSLQDHYNTAISCTEASQKLRNLLNSPVTNLDDFLSELLNLSIASVKDLPASEQNKSGFILATGYLTQYIHKYYPTLSSVIKHDFKVLQSTQRDSDPSSAFLGMMRVLRLHRDAIEASSKRNNPRNAINEIDASSSFSPIEEVAAAEPSPASQLEDIRELIKNEIRQNFPKPKPQQEGHTEQGQIKTMLQEVFHEYLGHHQTSQQPLQTTYIPQVEIPPYPEYVQEVSNQNWNRDRSQQNRVPNGMMPPNQQQGAFPKWNPQAGQGRPMLGGRPPFGQNPPMPRPNFSNNGNPNRMPLGNMGFAGPPRRNFVPEDVYAKYFSSGNCFKCGMQGHSYRQCPIFGQGNNVPSAPCPDCETHQIKAYHENCQGRNFRAHQNMTRSRDHPNQQAHGPSQVQQIDASQFYPEEGLSFLPTDPGLIQQNVPLYIPNNGDMSKN